MSRRALIAIVMLGALLVGVAWWGTQASEPEAHSPSPKRAAVEPAPAARDVASSAAPRADVGATSRRRVESEAEPVNAPSSGSIIGVGGGNRRAPKNRVLVVRTVDGAPIVGARLNARANARTPDRDAGFTDAAGRVSVVVEAHEQLVVAAEGYVPRSVRDDDDVVVLKRPTQVEGTVVDSQGRPIAGASVLRNEGSASAGLTSSDEIGRFRLDVDPDERDVGLAVRHARFVTWHGERHPGDLDVRVVLSRDCAVEGHVVLPDGRAATHGSVNRTEVEGDGAFLLEGLTAGEHVLQAWADELGRTYAAESTVRLADGETLRGVRIVLRENPRSFAVLRVVGPDGSPVKIGGARAQHDGGPATVGGGQIVVHVDAPPDREERVTLFRAASGETEYGDLQLDVVTRASPTGEPFVVTLPHMSTLGIIVLLPDESLSHRRSVRLEQSGGPLLHAAPEQKESMQARFRVAVGGSYRVHVDAEGFAPVVRDVTPDELAAGRATVRLSDGATVRVRLVARPPARLSEPWLVLGADGPTPWRLVPKNGVRTDGRYEIKHVRAGRCFARFSTCGGVDEKSLTIDVPESGVLDLGDVVLAGTTSLKGRVVAPDGRPAGGAGLGYFDARRVYQIDGVHAITRVDGTFEFDVPVGATGDLCVSKDGLGGVMLPLDGKASWMEVRLEAECRLRVVTRAHSPRGWDPSVALARPDGTGLWCPPLDGDPREGTAESVRTLRGLAPGKWVVRLYEETPPIEREVTLVADATTEVVIDEPR